MHGLAVVTGGFLCEPAGSPGPFLLVMHGGPLAPGNDDGWQPVYFQPEVMQLTQINVGGHLAILHDMEQMFGLGFDEHAVADGIKRL